MTPQHPEFLERPNGAMIAYNKVTGGSPGIIFLHGLMSDRDGTKATALANHCARSGQACVRFDMFGHGESTGRFEEGNISRWTNDAIAVIDHLTEGPQILVGSSMGGWVMVRAALARPERVAGLIGIAPGPDFTEDLIWNPLDTRAKADFQKNGKIVFDNPYEDTPITYPYHLIEDGRKHLHLHSKIPIHVPVRLLHGMQDVEVPWQTATRLATLLQSKDVKVILDNTATHRFSEPHQLTQLEIVLDNLLSVVS